MTPGRRLLVALGCAALLGTGCLSKSFPEKRRFQWTPERSGEALAACECSLRIERVRVARAFERRRFVYRTGEGTFEEDFYNEFYSPPGMEVRKAAGHWLDDSGAFARILGATDVARADWLLQGRVNELYADVREREARAVLEVEFTLLDARPNRPVEAFRKRYGAASPTERSADGIHAAWGRGLEQILAELEQDLRVHLAGARR